MNKQELETKSFIEALNELKDLHESITSYEQLKEFAKFNIDGDNMFLAIHILKALNDYSDYYDYDYCMGTLETPYPLRTLSDLTDYCGED